MERWDRPVGPLVQSTIEAGAGEVGFLIQPRRWAAALQGRRGDGLPDLAETERDIRVIHDVVGHITAVGGGSTPD